MVSVDPNTIDFSKPEWYYTHSWTTWQEQKYIEWMAQYLYNNTGARKELMRFPFKRKELCHKVAAWFTAMHLWVVKD